MLHPLGGTLQMNLSIRPWQPTAEDARAVLRVDGETFRQCPYDEATLVALARRGTIRVWLALAGGDPVGYLCAFLTQGMEGPRWELDLLAVCPAFRGRGVGRSLIRTAVRAAPRGALVRAWVAVENAPSHRAFAAAGLRPLPTPCELWAYAIRGLRPRPLEPCWPPVLPVQSPEDAQAWARGHGGQAERVLSLAGQGVMAWLAGREAGMLVLPVQTLHYRGLWLEELWVRDPWRSAVSALLSHAVEWAKARELDEVGIMVPQGAFWREALPAQGYGLVATYREYHLQR